MPYRRLCGFYFCYFAAVGALIPYLALYLQSISFTPVQIGALMALLAVSRIIAPNLWSWVSDLRRQRMRLVRLTTLAATIAFAGTLMDTGFGWMAAVVLLFAFFWDACLPQMEAATLNHLRGQRPQYARIRLWGSVGFILTAVGMGIVLERAGTWWLLPSMLVLLASVCLATLLVPEAPREPVVAAAGPSLPRLFLQTPVLGFLAACLLMHASHGPYYTFYSIYLEESGYTRDMIGMLWAFGVLCEIGVFLLMPRLHARINLQRILLLSFAVAVARWLLIGHFPQRLAVLLLAQVLHGATFGAYHAAAIELVYRFFVGRYQVRGQAIYGSVGFGLGGTVGSLYSGFAWARLGSTHTFELAALLAGLAFLLAWVALRPGVGIADSGSARAK